MLMTVFLKVLSMSMTASFVIVVVLLARFLLRRSPRIFSYILWTVVLFRLLCPISVASPVSLVPREVLGNIPNAQPEISEPAEEPQQESRPLQVLQPNTTGETVGKEMDPSASGRTALQPILCGLWLTGIAGIWAYSALSYLRLRRKLSNAVPLRDNIYISDHIPSPCVAGSLRQRIYLPASLSAEEQPYIIAHEQHHIRRGDPFIRFLAFTALTIHWFNPLVWLSFQLLVKDMEMSCDEAVLRKLGPEIRGDYSQSLLNLAVGRSPVTWTPLTFGENDTEARIKNVLRWRKSTAWTVMAALVLSTAVSVCALTDPVAEVLEEQPAQSVEIGHMLQNENAESSMELNESQMRVLERCLKNVASSEIYEDAYGAMRSGFTVALVVDSAEYILRYGHRQGESYVTLGQNGSDIVYIVENEQLKQCLYHFYISDGAIDMHFTELPEDAHLRSSHHAEGCNVNLYDYYCHTCEQLETAVVSFYCGCGNCIVFWRKESLEILSKK